MLIWSRSSAQTDAIGFPFIPGLSPTSDGLCFRLAFKNDLTSWIQVVKGSRYVSTDQNSIITIVHGTLKALRKRSAELQKGREEQRHKSATRVIASGDVVMSITRSKTGERGMDNGKYATPSSALDS